MYYDTHVSVVLECCFGIQYSALPAVAHVVKAMLCCCRLSLRHIRSSGMMCWNARCRRLELLSVRKLLIVCDK